MAKGEELILFVKGFPFKSINPSRCSGKTSADNGEKVSLKTLNESMLKLYLCFYSLNPVYFLIALLNIYQ